MGNACVPVFWLIAKCRFGARLVSIKENKKFQETEKVLSSQSNGLKEFVSEVKKNFGLKYAHFPLNLFFIVFFRLTL